MFARAEVGDWLGSRLRGADDCSFLGEGVMDKFGGSGRLINGSTPFLGIS